jgi:hypothetical protein
LTLETMYCPSINYIQPLPGPIGCYNGPRSTTPIPRPLCH